MLFDHASLCPTLCPLSASKPSPITVRTAAATASLLPTHLLPTHTHVGTLGCAHYERSCKLLAPCCGTYFTCRLCHDAFYASLDGHTLPRAAVSTVLCMTCSTPQAPGAACIACDTLFADYFCEPCRLYADDDGGGLYHCEKCGICRRGNREENHHCDRCNACVVEKPGGSVKHSCTPTSMEGDCPVCCGDLFGSTRKCVYLKCGHAMHDECLMQLAQRDYRCCLCLKAFFDMSVWYQRIDALLDAEEDMPLEYRTRRVEILCNDCGDKGIRPWHYEYHKCVGTACGGYNTRVLDMFEQDDQS